MIAGRPFFRRPLALVLSGGGALGSWQAAALAALAGAGLEFDSVLGFSAGALAGAYYALGRIDEAVRRWRAHEGTGLHFSPRLFPPSLFSDVTIREGASCAADDAAAKSALRCRLVVVSARRSRDRAFYGVFTPGGRDGWDGPLHSHLLASCSIPLIFPPVRLEFRGERLTAFDGGVPCSEPMSFEALGPCGDALVLDVVRPEEKDRRPPGLFAGVDHQARVTMRTLIGQGLASLRARSEPPRIFRLAPSRILAYKMLDLNDHSNIDASLELGAEDARRFLKDPASFEERA
ncbi:MAG: patatin-like phospholipase family protein [Elusimicrobia bacterium]|nr:patatin-like phospholipase family protein [Elusimicrobiota bacterium]